MVSEGGVGSPGGGGVLTSEPLYGRIEKVSSCMEDGLRKFLHAWRASVGLPDRSRRPGGAWLGRGCGGSHGGGGRGRMEGLGLG